MGRLVDISWPELEISVVAELADEQNPELCEEFWQNCPSRSCRRTQWSRASRSTPGRQSSPPPVRHRERIIDCPIGRMRYSQATGNKFSIQYGKGLEPLAQPVLGTVLDEYLDLLPKVGRRSGRTSSGAKSRSLWRSSRMAAPPKSSRRRVPRTSPRRDALPRRGRQGSARRAEGSARSASRPDRDTGSYGSISPRGISPTGCCATTSCTDLPAA